MRVAVAIDDWKLPIFDRQLKQLGYSYEQVPGVVPNTFFLLVLTENVEALAEVIKTSNLEASLTGKDHDKNNFG
jgi:hypothetical protein